MKSIAFLSCAHIHTPNFVTTVRDRGIPCLGVWDDDAERGAESAAILGCTVRTMEEILADPAVDAVVICSQTRQHAALVEKVVAAKKAMFVEKPLGMGTADALAMADQIEKAGLVFQSGYFNRGNPKIRTIKQWIDSGKLGTVTRARFSNCHNGALGGWFDTKWRWMADVAEAGVGGYGDLGTHGLDIILWLFGAVDSATATLSTGTARYPGCDEFGEGMIRFKSGVIGTLAAGWDDVADPVRVEIMGTEGHMTVFNDELYIVCPAEKLDGKTPYTDLAAAESAGFVAFLDWCEGKPANLVPVREACYSSQVLDALYEGARTSRWVTV